MYWHSEPQKQDLFLPFCTQVICKDSYRYGTLLFQPFTIFATFCLEMKYVGMKLTCYFHNLPKEMFLCGFVSYEDVKVIKCWLWHNIKVVCIGKKIAQSFPLVYFMESNNNFATGQALQFIYSEKTRKFKKKYTFCFENTQ